jgi:predicted Zn-dependent protease
LELAVAGLPQSVDARYELAKIYVNTLQLDSAVKMAKEALKLDPKNYDSSLLLGFVYVNQNNPAAAIPHLKAASGERPNAARPHEYMAQAYGALGNKALANKEQALADELKQKAAQ